jgi:diguanylate cyclase (GGDEF)-like protein
MSHRKGKDQAAPRHLPLLVPLAAWTGLVLWLAVRLDLRAWLADRSLMGPSALAGGLASFLLMAVLPVGLSALVVRGWSDLVEWRRRPAAPSDHDALTGLPSRTLLYERLCRALAGVRRDGSRLAVLFLDLDGFKRVNDNYGHEVGDELLVAVARRLSEVVRDGDLLTRVGGDEFVVVCERVPSAKDAEAIAERLALALGSPLFLSGERSLSVRASIGVTLADLQATPESLLREADAAMYRAKADGGGRHVTFDRRMKADVQLKVLMESRLRQAVEKQEFRLHYQPVFSVADRRLAGFEALLRWDSDVGPISPAEFVPLLEETGLIVPVGAWVLEEACTQAVRWRGRFRNPVTMAVNVSPCQLAVPDFAECVTTILARTGIDPTRVCLEITEAALMDDVVAAWSTLRRLKGLGVKLAIDDFGTGYSSLSYLKSFALDVVKVDRSFVRGLGESVEDTAIVRAVVTLAAALGLDAVAEGVETPDQLAAIEAMGCPYAQGYYFTRPEPPEVTELVDRVKRHLHWQGTVGRGEHGEALELEREDDEVAYRRIVVGHEDDGGSGDYVGQYPGQFIG